MEPALKCNNLKCKTELRDRALVTNCSHVFCLQCASNSGLTGHRADESRVCPACRTQLCNPDDAVITNLHPTEDYKMSVLSGLSPNIIMECAGRALGFWEYQMVQELVYKDYLEKNLSERYSKTQSHLDKVISDANTQIESLQAKIAGMSLDQDSLRQEKEEMTLAYKEKSRKLLQTQELYDKLKRKAMLGQIQDAASDAVDSLQASTAADTTFTHQSQSHHSYQQQRDPGNSNIHATDRYAPASAVNHFAGPSGIHPMASAWNQPLGPQNMPTTPSTHRQRADDAAGLGLSAVPGLVSRTPMSHHSTGHRQIRQPLLNSHSNGHTQSTNFHGVGLSSGLKASHGVGVGVGSGYAASSARPRVAQRPIGSLYP